MRQSATEKGMGQTWAETGGGGERHGLEMRLALGFGSDWRRTEGRVNCEKSWNVLRKTV